MEVENLEEESAEVENSPQISIPDGLPGSANPRKTFGAKPEQIGIKRRGRPRGSTSSNPRTREKQKVSSAQSSWTEYGAIVLSITTAAISVRMTKDHTRKYQMTKEEAVSASSGIIVFIFQYEQIRQLAALSANADSPGAAVIKGFMPYITRVFLKDVIENVIAGLFVPRTKSGKSNNVGSNKSPNVSGDVANGNHAEQSGFAEPLISIGSESDWRAI